MLKRFREAKVHAIFESRQENTGVSICNKRILSILAVTVAQLKLR